MVVASLEAVGVPVIDLSRRREVVMEMMVKASEELGFFKVINHGVAENVVEKMEAEAVEFFALPAAEKQLSLSGPANPMGYGVRNIGFNGDAGELEYLLLHANHHLSLSHSHRARNICKNNPMGFSHAVNEYVGVVRELACDILDKLGEGLGLTNRMVFSSLLRDKESDSLLRLNHYPPYHRNKIKEEMRNSGKNKKDNYKKSRIGFGEHSDPQILTLLRSNDVPGLQIQSYASGVGQWIPVAPDPNAFFVMVGDALQAMTNGRLMSVRHRAMANSSYMARLSTVFFGAPPLNTWISPLSEMITPLSPRRYKSFTWGDYKKAMYSLRLSRNRLDLFQADDEGGDIDLVTR